MAKTNDSQFVELAETDVGWLAEKTETDDVRSAEATETVNRRFAVVGIKPQEQEPQAGKMKWYQGKPLVSMLFFAVIVLGCLFSDFFIPKDPAYMDLQNCSVPPGRTFLFGTDAMGRDVFSMVWHGGRASLFIGFAAALISAAAAILFGSASGLAPQWLDTLMMRLAEILLSVPGLLAVILLQAAWGGANVLSISFAIGITGWADMAKVIRTEVRQLRASEYVIASRCMGGSFFHILRKHLAPNFIPSILFMVVMDIRSAMIAESTLSFMGIGLPLEVVSWGSMLSLSERALLNGDWWLILVPGLFLVGTVLSVTDIGNYLQRKADSRERMGYLHET